MDRILHIKVFLSSDEGFKENVNHVCMSHYEESICLQNMNIRTQNKHGETNSLSGRVGLKRHFDM